MLSIRDDDGRGSGRCEKWSLIMVAKSESGLKTTMEELSKTRKKYDLKINFKKTKVMRVLETSVKYRRDHYLTYDRWKSSKAREPVLFFMDCSSRIMGLVQQRLGAELQWPRNHSKKKQAPFK